jgi:hypothetical protein
MLGLHITDEIPQPATQDLGGVQGLSTVGQGEAEPFLIDRGDLIPRVQLVEKIRHRRFRTGYWWAA